MHKNFISDSVVSLLGKGPVLKKDIISTIKKDKGVTFQAIYKELKKLIKDGTLLFHGGYLSLNLMFVSKEYSKWANILNVYEGGKNLKTHFLDLTDGEFVNLKFKTLNDLDAYWVHASLILDNLTKPKISSYSVIPHDWFSYARQETDAFWTKSQKEKMRIIINSKLPLDKEVAHKRIKAGYKICVGENPLRQKNNTYYTLIGGFVLKITLDRKIQTLLSNFIQNTRSISTIDYDKLDKIMNMKCKCTMKISNNQSKFLKMTNKCKKYFA